MPKKKVEKVELGCLPSFSFLLLLLLPSSSSSMSSSDPLSVHPVIPLLLGVSLGAAAVFLFKQPSAATKITSPASSSASSVSSASSSLAKSLIFPAHYAFPVHDLKEARAFYAGVLGCAEGRSSDKWQDYSLYGHQIVCHWVGSDYRGIDHFNPVDGDEVPVPHFGACLSVPEFTSLAEKLKGKGVKFIIEPHLRFPGQPGEQYTMFFKDPSGNNLEFKAMTIPENLFAKYHVTESK